MTTTATTTQPLAMRTSSPQRHLFVDLLDVAEMTNLEQRVGPAEKHPANPVMPVGHVNAWDGAQASPWAMRGVAYDPQDRLFKCWYNGTDHLLRRWWGAGYACSEDGVSWVKPHLGLVEYNGSKDNNLWSPDPYGIVILDEHESDPDKRFKLFGHWSPQGCFRAVHYSPDGLHWRLGYGFNIHGWGGNVIHDCVNFMRDQLDPDPQRRYKIVWQSYAPNHKSGPDQVRVKCLAWSPGEADFTSNPANPILHPNDSFEQENHFAMLFTYQGLYIFLYECAWYTPNGLGRFGSYNGDVRLAVSRDGEHFTRIQPSQPIIARGEPGTWDESFLVMANAPVIRADGIYLYYCGQGREWTHWPPGNSLLPRADRQMPNPDQLETSHGGRLRLSQMGLAKLRQDGFACLATPDGQSVGAARTTPIDLDTPGVSLRVNVARTLPQRSFVQVAVIDAGAARPLAGMDFDDCLPLCTDAIDAPVRWRQAALDQVRCERIRLAFRVCGSARLYAYRFAQP